MLEKDMPPLLPTYFCNYIYGAWDNDWYNNRIS